jgi:hypothetical protein
MGRNQAGGWFEPRSLQIGQESLIPGDLARQFPTSGA